jgi:hypothetical protein
LSSPETALEKLRESLLIAFSYAERDRKFPLIADYPDRSPGSERDLIALVFTEVSKFEREPGDLLALRRFVHHFAARHSTGVHLLQDIQTEKCVDGTARVSIWFGTNLGGSGSSTKAWRALRGAHGWFKEKATSHITTPSLVRNLTFTIRFLTYVRRLRNALEKPGGTKRPERP